jgi:hypothetical protein
MMNPLISCYGFMPQSYATYVNTERFITELIAGSHANNGRIGCYAVPPCLHELVQHLSEKFELDINIENDCEVFSPEMTFPQHVDFSGLSLAIPLTAGASITIDTFTLATDKWGIYMFNDAQPHNTVGTFLMITLNQGDVYAL